MIRDYAHFRETLTTMIPRLPHRIEDGARYVLDHPDDVAVRSMREVARMARVSPATLSRLAALMQIGGWSELKALHTDHFRRVPPAYADRAAQLISRRDGTDIVHECFAAGHSNLEHTYGANAANEFLNAARLLSDARRLYVSAFLSCRGPGHTFAYVARMLRDDVVFLGTDATSLASELQGIGSEDALLTINFRPYSRDIAQISDAVQQRGAALVCLSDSRATPLTPFARSILVFSPDCPSFFPSLTAATAAVEALLAAMLAYLGDDARTRIDDIEQRLYASGTYADTKDDRWDFEQRPTMRTLR